MNLDKLRAELERLKATAERGGLERAEIEAFAEDASTCPIEKRHIGLFIETAHFLIENLIAPEMILLYRRIRPHARYDNEFRIGDFRRKMRAALHLVDETRAKHFGRRLGGTGKPWSIFHGYVSKRLSHRMEYQGAIQQIINEGMPQPGMVVEFGSGSDPVFGYIGEIERGEYDWTQVDLDDIALKVAKHTVGGKQLLFDVIETEAMLNQIPKESSDVVVAFDLVADIPSTKEGAALDTMDAILAPGGRMIIMSDLPYWPGTGMKLLNRIKKVCSRPEVANIKERDWDEYAGIDYRTERQFWRVDLHDWEGLNRFRSYCETLREGDENYYLLQEAARQFGDDARMLKDFARISLASVADSLGRKGYGIKIATKDIELQDFSDESLLDLHYLVATKSQTG